MSFNMHKIKRQARREAWYGEAVAWNPFKNVKQNTYQPALPPATNLHPTEDLVPSRPEKTTTISPTNTRDDADTSVSLRRFQDEELQPHKYREFYPDELQWDPFGSLSDHQIITRNINNSMVSASNAV
jgi:hypothetical protein